jgi:uncharacterized protein YggE
MEDTMRLITVQGEGKIIQSPDTIELNVELVTLNKDYEKMMEEAIKKQNLLTYQLTSIGFDKEDIQTSNFTINTKYESVSDNTGNYKNVFVGYESRQNIVLEFPMNTEFLGEVIDSITTNMTKPNISIRFTIKDKQSLIDVLLENAVKDAINKANILTGASGVGLGEVQTIEYKNQVYRIYSDTLLAPTAMYSMEKIDIVPKDIELTEYVTMSFEII